MRCLDCKSNVLWVSINEERFMQCQRCKTYYKLENNKAVKVDPFAKGSEESARGKPAVQVGEEHQLPVKPSSSSRGRYMRKETPSDRLFKQED